MKRARTVIWACGNFTCFSKFRKRRQRQAADYFKYQHTNAVRSRYLQL